MSRLRVEVLSIATRGDCVRIEAQGPAATDAEWRPLRCVHIDMPEHEARRYRIGDMMEVRVRPMRRRKP